MNRMEEYRRLLTELEATPPALEYTLQRAKARRRHGLWKKGLGIPAGSLAAVFAAFVLLVNVSTPFALACSNVPFLKDLTAAVAFSPSLKAAVEHDFVQYIGQTQTQNGITMTLDYLIPDQGQLLFFATVTGPEEMESFLVHPDCTDESGAELEGFSSSSRSIEPGVLSDAFSLITNGAAEPILPNVLRLECEVEGRVSGASSEDGWSPDAVFTFEFPLNSALLSQGETVSIGQWLELDGNQIYVDTLEIYPTHARLTLEESPGNTETLQGLEFYLEDEHGNRYEKGSSSGIAALGNSYWCESPYFSRSEHLTLYFTEAEWLEKGREYVTIDLEAGIALDPLPDGVRVSVRRISDQLAHVAFLAPEPPEADEEHMHFYQIAQMSCRTPSGEERHIGGVSSMRTDKLWPNTPDETDVPEGFFCEEYLLEDYPWDTVEWELHFTHRTAFDIPVSLTVQ